jgi:hypothetical protein
VIDDFRRDGGEEAAEAMRGACSAAVTSPARSLPGLSSCSCPPSSASRRLRHAYRLLYALDLPNNTVPSLHIISSALIALAIVRAATPVSKVVFGLWLALLSSSSTSITCWT